MDPRTTDIWGRNLSFKGHGAGVGQDTPVGVQELKQGQAPCVSLQQEQTCAQKVTLTRGPSLEASPVDPAADSQGTEGQRQTCSPVTRDTALRASQPVAMANPRN